MNSFAEMSGTFVQPAASVNPPESLIDHFTESVSSKEDLCDVPSPRAEILVRRSQNSVDRVEKVSLVPSLLRTLLVKNENGGVHEHRAVEQPGPHAVIHGLGVPTSDLGVVLSKLMKRLGKRTKTAMPPPAIAS